MGIDAFGAIVGLIPILVILLVIGIITTGYVKAPADKAFIISGPHKNPKILIGRAGIMIPFLERKDVLLLKQISIDIKTNGFVPTLDFIGVDIDAIAKVRIMDTPDGLERAAKNFLNMNEEKIIQALTDSLQGNMREIIGTIKLKDLNTDRKQFGDQVQQKAQLDMNALGIEIISCNIQRVEDKDGLINSLGQENMSQIQKDASIAKANADRDIAIAQAEAAREANEAQVAANTIIAEKQNELKIKQAELKKVADVKQAEADAAYEIQQQEQQKSIETATVNAQIARAEREAELKKQEVAVKEQTLDAEIRKKAEADKFAEQQKADADLYKRQREAEARKFEVEKQAEAKKAEAEAAKYAKEQEAEGIRAVGEAEARAIEAKGVAEAEALDRKAEAMKKYGQAAILEMIVDKLPAITEAAAKPYGDIDNFTVFGGGNGSDGVGDLVPKNIATTRKIVNDLLGVDVADIVRKNTYDAQVTKNINVTGLTPEVAKEVTDDVKKDITEEATDNAKKDITE